MDDDKLKELLQELGNAINESLSDSDRIAEAIGEIKLAGYDVFLILEATIGFSRREYDEEEITKDPAAPPIKLKWDSQDQKFLRALHIAIDKDEK